jgi:hypothetical protein
MIIASFQYPRLKVPISLTTTLSELVQLTLGGGPTFFRADQAVGTVKPHKESHQSFPFECRLHTCRPIPRAC